MEPDVTLFTTSSIRADGFLDSEGPILIIERARVRSAVEKTAFSHRHAGFGRSAEALEVEAAAERERHARTP